MDDARSLLTEYAIEVEGPCVESQPHLARAVVVNSRPARSEAGIRHVDLVAMPPRPSLVDLRPFEIDMATREVVGWAMADHLRGKLCERGTPW